MGRAVQVDTSATLVGADYVAITFPNQTTITQIHIAGTGAFNATLYNRMIVGSALAVQSILNRDSKCLVVMEEGVYHNYQVGDSVVVASSGVGGYNTTHVVTAVLNSSTFITDQTYSADDNPSSATATLTVPTAQRPAYEVMPLTAAVSNVVRDTTWREFVSRQRDLVSVNRPQAVLYLLLSAADTYQISIRGEME